MIAKGKISESESGGDGSGDDDFAEFMRWKQQKRRAARRGMNDWDQVLLSFFTRISKFLIFKLFNY